MTKNRAIRRAIASIPDTAWTPVRYPGAVQDPDTGAWISDAEVAEVPTPRSPARGRRPASHHGRRSRGSTRPVTTTTSRRDREVQLLSSAAARRKPLRPASAPDGTIGGCRRWSDPTVVVRESFLAAMREFADEGRAGDDTMVGRDLREWGGRWETDEGFEAYVAAVRARPGGGRAAPARLGSVHHAVVGRPERPISVALRSDTGSPRRCGTSAATSDTTCAAQRDGGGMPPRCSPPRCPAAHSLGASTRRW